METQIKPLQDAIESIQKNLESTIEPMREANKKVNKQKIQEIEEEAEEDVQRIKNRAMREVEEMISCHRRREINASLELEVQSSIDSVRQKSILARKEALGTALANANISLAGEPDDYNELIEVGRLAPVLEELFHEQYGNCQELKVLTSRAKNEQITE